MAVRDAVLVAGAGALGSVFGGLLARAGAGVTLLGRPPHMAAIRERGLAIDGLFGAHRVDRLACVTAVEHLAGLYDAILLTVKAWDTRAMAERVAPLLSPSGVVICLQNGLGNLEMVAEIAGPSRVLGGRVIFGAEVPEPGRVRVTVIAEPVLLGSPDPGDEARNALAGDWARRIDAAGIPTQYTERLVSELWAKLFYNAALNPLGALLGVTYGRLAEEAATRAVMDAVIDETFAIARADGVQLAWATPMEYRQAFYDRLVPSTADHRSSMLQDLERGRPTEIEAINGYVVRRGAVHGVPTPVNERLTEAIRARVRERAGDQP
jgi:2-dehydropantoate 2-reductase